MQTVHIEELFMIGGRTLQNYRFIVAGLAPALSANMEIASLGAAVAALSIPEHCAPDRLDLLLAKTLRQSAGVIPIAGCTIEVPDLDGFSGGVLGETAQEPLDAGGELEKLAGGWTLLTFPGSPGMACDTEIAHIPDSVRTVCTLGKADDKAIVSLAAFSQSAGASRSIAITDGSGAGACGAALIRKGSQLKLWRLKEV
ncbi:MAG: hypothetical protein P4N59_02715 [Negativicutes bacterium]|nr:hypothetical protein [Negativicutes bacterium]